MGIYRLPRDLFERVVPAIATGPQYKYYWGKPADLIRRLLYSAVGTLLGGAIATSLGPGLVKSIFFVSAIAALFYWLWAPVALASWRNRQFRQRAEAGLWQGEVWDIFLSEELTSKQEKVNQRRELVVVENRERCLNLEIGDETGFSTVVRASLNRNYKAIRPGDWVEAIVVSESANFSRILDFSDLYLPESNLWVGEYPYLEREAFLAARREVFARRRRRRAREAW